MGLLLWRKRKKISTICLGFRVGSTRFALMRKILKNEEELSMCTVHCRRAQWSDKR